MWVELNIGLLFGVLLPPLLYMFILYLTSPFNSVTLKRSILYFLAGILSINFVHMYYAFIDVHTYTHFYEQFFGVGPREEICKLLAFLGVTLAFKKENTHPVGIMYYMGIVGLGFAMFENLHYVFRYGEQVLYSRTFTSTLGHLIFCMFSGYWLGLAKIDRGAYGNRSIFGFYMHKYKNIRTVTYTIIGLICAITFHGLWNFNLAMYDKSSMSILILMLVTGLTTCKFAATDLYNHYRKSLYNIKKDISSRTIK